MSEGLIPNSFTLKTVKKEQRKTAREKEKSTANQDRQVTTRLSPSEY